jgi:hypothetical protein
MDANPSRIQYNPFHDETNPPPNRTSHHPCWFVLRSPVLLFPGGDEAMKVYIVVYRGTVYGVFDSREKASASEYGDLYDANIMEMDIK